MKFCTVINCIDGRVQLPAIKYLKEKFNVESVDSITEAGPSLILSEGKDTTTIQAILGRLNISIKQHNSLGIAIAGHHDCAANPAPQNDQIIHIQKSIQFLQKHYKNVSGLFG